jgi:hypothetical protein
MLWSDPAVPDPVPALFYNHVLHGRLDLVLKRASVVFRRIPPRLSLTSFPFAVWWVQERSATLDSQGFGLSPRGCRSFGETAIDLFLSQHRFQHVFRVRPCMFSLACSRLFFVARESESVAVM